MKHEAAENTHHPPQIRHIQERLRSDVIWCAGRDTKKQMLHLLPFFEDKAYL